MLIDCPVCRHPIRVVDLRPGRFTPMCPRCERPFQIIVPEAGAAPLVSGLQDSLVAIPVPLGTPAPGPAPAAAAPDNAGTDWPVSPGEVEAPSMRPAPLPSGIPRLLAGYVVLRLMGHGPRGAWCWRNGSPWLGGR